MTLVRADWLFSGLYGATGAVTAGALAMVMGSARPAELILVAAAASFLAALLLRIGLARFTGTSRLPSSVTWAFGALVTVIAHALFVAYLVFVAHVRTNSKALHGYDTLEWLVMWVFGLLLFGWVTVPVGALLAVGWKAQREDSA
jgi:hypothetical protein